MKYNIADVAAMLGIQPVSKGYAPPGTMNVICPFCGDKRGKCNLVIDSVGKHDIFNCFNCGERGTMYDLYARLKGLSGSGGIPATTVAAKMIRRSCGMNGRDETYTRQIVPAGVKADKADPGIIDRTYRGMLSLLTLKEEHRRSLLNRGLEEEQINRRRFYSTPDDPKGITRRLLGEGYQVRGVPGFYKDRKGDWTLNFHKGNSGILCPVLSWDGMIEGFQIRLDQPKGDAKYLWLSSSGKDSGVSSGSPATFFGEKEAETAIITEGILKAAVIFELAKEPGNGCRNISVVGVPGIGSLSSLAALLKSMPNLHTVYEAFDMDKHMPVECGMDDKHCSECKAYEISHSTGKGCGICPYKKEKRDHIEKAWRNLMGLTCGYKRASLVWDYHLDASYHVPVVDAIVL